MGTRLDLQAALEALQPGLNVYFQPPPTDEVLYPAIIYNRDWQSVHFADNIPYKRVVRWAVTVIDRNPDSLIPDLVAQMPMTTFVRHYTTEGLYHDIYDVYF